MSDTMKFSVEALDGYTPLAPDEPVFAFRARDRFMPDILERYADMCERAGSPEEHIESIRMCRLAAIEWQRHHGARTPD
jgi:hypothetical protein